MNKKHRIHFAARPLSAAILMALASPMALAAGLPTVSATQLPGHGLVLTPGASAGLSISSQIPAP